MGAEIGETGLQEDGGVVAVDGVDAGGGVAGEDDAGEKEGNDVLAAEEGVAGGRNGDGGGAVGGDTFLIFDGLHLGELAVGLLRGAGAEESGAGGVGAAFAEEPAGRL